MRVIFLDHFGVMCLADKHGIIHGKDSPPNFSEMRVHGNFDTFNKSCVIILNSILELSGAEIVVSSDWKLWCDFDRMADFYNKQGIIKTPIAYTKSLSGIKDLKIQRSLEIKAWVMENPDISNWVAVDDMFLPDLSNFVWVNRTDEGLTQEGIKEKMLNFLVP